MIQSKVKTYVKAIYSEPRLFFGQGFRATERKLELAKNLVKPDI